MPRKKAAGTKRGSTSRALAPARPSRKKVSARRAARAVGQLAVIGTKIAAEKVKQTVARGKRAAARNSAATYIGKAVLKAGLAAAVTVTAEELARRGTRQ